MREERFEVISALDPAIDTERMTTAQMQEYLRTRDTKLLEPFIKPGMRPTRFRIREVPYQLWWDYVKAVPEGELRYVRAFLAGVERVTDLAQRDGTFLPTFEGASGLETMRTEVLARFDHKTVEEVGFTVYKHSDFPLRNECNFAPPHSFLETLSERPFLHAGASRTSPAKSSDAASSAAESAPAQQPPTDPISSSTESGSDSPMAATATGTPFRVSA